VKIKQLLLSFMLFGYAAFSFSSETDSTAYPSFKFDGTLKNKFEYVPEVGTSRFSVRNSRLGVSGKIFPMVDYRAQVELSSEGKFQVLDLSGSIKPYEGLSFTLGQTSIPIYNSYTTNPGTMMFANRTFLAKYYGGTRDIGFLTKYDFDALQIPMSAEFGIFNSNVINSPTWRDKLSYAARISFGDMKGFRSTFKVYDYPNSPEIHHFMYGADLRYEGKNWKVETEAMKRDDKVNNDKDLFAYYLQGAYSFKLKENYLFKNIMPAVRYDFIDQIADNKIDVSRLTFGLGFGLGKKAFSSLLRIDYEWYFKNNQLDFLNQYEEMDADKLTVELVYIF
jgi:hypothetical protein